MKRLRYLLISIVVIMVFTCPVNIVFANESKYASDNGTVVSDVSNSIETDSFVKSKEETKKIKIKETIDSKNTIRDIKKYIKNSLKVTNEKATISPQKKWIPTYTISGIKYAYFVPLYKKGTKKIYGYSVVTSLNQNERELVHATGAESIEYTKHIIKAAKPKKNKLVYEFPDVFLVKKGDKYFHIKQSGNLTHIRNEDIEEIHNMKTLEYLAQDSKGISAAATVTYAQLSHWDKGQFVPITDGRTTYYGGFQSWLQDEGIKKEWADRSCGVTAAANMMYYLSRYKSGKTNLYTQTGITKNAFSKYQKDVYNYLSPSVIGIPDTSSMTNRIKNFAKSRKVDLTEVMISTNVFTWNEPYVRNFVSAGLKSECPVLLLTWHSPSIPDLNIHWVTVTRLYNDGNSTKMVTSNWGNQKIYDFSTWVSMITVGRGVLYFK